MGGALVQRWGAATAVEGNVLPRYFSVVDRSPSVKTGEAPLLPPRFGFYESLSSLTEKLSSPDAPPPVDALLLAVRPKQILSALTSWLTSCAPLCSKQTAILSLAAGLPLARMRASLADAHPLFRVMPSIPVAIGEGILLVSGEQPPEQQASEAVRTLFAPMGSSVFCSEDLLEKGTGLWGSAPGYIFHMLEAFEAAACALGYDAEQARVLAFQTFKGVGLFAEKERAEHNASPRELTQSIALAGGTTEAGLTVLADKEKGLIALMKQASRRAHERAQARILSFQTFKGVGLFGEQERKEKNATPRALTQSIALKGGTTEAGLTVLADQEKGLVALMKQASLRAYQRSLKMAQETDKP